MSEIQKASEVVQGVESEADFTRQLQEWLDFLKTVSSKKQFLSLIEAAPELLAEKLVDRGQCDAYLAAYVDWLCGEHGLKAPAWVSESERVSEGSGYDDVPLWERSFVEAPEAFERRGVHRQPENVLTFKRGRPRVSEEQKRAKSAERQRRYRARIRELVAIARAQQDGEA